MREITTQLLEQADEELRAAGDNLESGNFFVVAFLSQQAVEMLLKAVYIVEKKQAPPHTHNLRQLVMDLDDVDRKVISYCRRLNPHYFQSRYPDASNGTPFRQYDKEMGEELLGYAKETFKYFKERIHYES